MSTEQNLWGGYVSDTDPSLQYSTSNLKFGLNTKVFLTTFEYSTATGTGGTEGNPALIIKINVNGTERNVRKYDPTVPGGKVYYRGKEVLDKNSADYQAGLQEAVKSTKAYITHFLKAAGKTEEQIQAIYATATNFQTLVSAAQNAILSSITGKQPFDLFLQYQGKVKDGKQTYLEIPETLLYGGFITAHVPAQGGEWTEERSWTETDEAGNQIVKSGIRYVDGQGNKHRFERDENFIKSKNASLQTAVGGPNVSGNPTPVTPSTSNPSQQAWT